MNLPKKISGLIFFLSGLALAVAETNSFFSASENLPAAKALGWQVACEKEINGIELSENESSCFLSGFSLGVQNRRLPFEAREMFSDVQIFSKVKRQRLVEDIKRKSSAAAESFLANWGKTATVTKLPDGVCFEIQKPGDGAFPKPAQTVHVHYFSRLVNGTDIAEFGPDDLILVTNHLNHGLFEGIQRIGVGGKIKLFLPPVLSEPEAEMAGAPHGSALVCDLELLAVKTTPANELADALTPPAPESPDAAFSGKFSTNDVLEAWGWEIAQRSRLWQLLLNENEQAALRKGFETGVQGNALPAEAEIARPQIESFVASRMQQFKEAFRQKQIAAMDKLFLELDQNTNVVKQPDGLRYEVLKPGVAPFPKEGQIVLVNYTGRTLDGRVFDQTVNEPLHVEVGRVIRGWNEGIQKIGAGGKIKLFIPPSLGYGAKGGAGVPPYTMLVYEIELLQIEKLGEK